jgi:hypothetical protein
MKYKKNKTLKVADVSTLTEDLTELYSINSSKSLINQYIF